MISRTPRPSSQIPIGGSTTIPPTNAAAPRPNSPHSQTTRPARPRRIQAAVDRSRRRLLAGEPVSRCGVPGHQNPAVSWRAAACGLDRLIDQVMGRLAEEVVSGRRGLVLGAFAGCRSASAAHSSALSPLSMCSFVTFGRSPGAGTRPAASPLAGSAAVRSPVS